MGWGSEEGVRGNELGPEETGRLGKAGERRKRKLTKEPWEAESRGHSQNKGTDGHPTGGTLARLGCRERQEGVNL